MSKRGDKLAIAILGAVANPSSIPLRSDLLQILGELFPDPIPAPEPGPVYSAPVTKLQMQPVPKPNTPLPIDLDKYADGVAPHVVGGYQLGTAGGESKAEPVYRTVEEVVDAYYPDYRLEYRRQKLREILSRYRPKSEADRMLDWLESEKRSVGYSVANDDYYCTEGIGYTYSGRTLRDAIRAAMAAEKVKT